MNKYPMLPVLTNDEIWESLAAHDVVKELCPHCYQKYKAIFDKSFIVIPYGSEDYENIFMCDIAYCMNRPRYSVLDINVATGRRLFVKELQQFFKRKREGNRSRP